MKKITFVGSLLFLSGCAYVREAVHFTADINDKNVSYAQPIRAVNPQFWNYSTFKIKNDSAEKELFSFLEDFHTSAFLIIYRDSILVEKYWDKYNSQSQTNSFSMSKSIVSALIGIAIQEGYIKSIDQKVSEFLPEFSKGEKSNITIRHLLTMTSGLNWGERYASPFSDVARAYYGRNLNRIILHQKIKYEPGTVYYYKSGDAQILATILMKARGKSLSKYLEEKIWKPLGMESDAYWNKDRKNGAERAFCCLYATARDWAKFGSLYLHNGNWKGTQIVPKDWVRKSVTPPDSMKDEEGKSVHYYGYQWWIQGNRFFYADGHLGQHVIIVPNKQMVIVRMGGKGLLYHYLAPRIVTLAEKIIE